MRTRHGLRNVQSKTKGEIDGRKISIFLLVYSVSKTKQSLSSCLSMMAITSAGGAEANAVNCQARRAAEMVS